MGCLRQRHTAPEIVGRLAFLAGLLPEPQPVDPRQLVDGFDWQRVPLDDIVMG
jgi:glutamyl-tRNA synthetase